MKVGVVCPYDLGSPGGVQQLTSELCQQLRRAGHEVAYVGAGKAVFDGGPGRDDVTVPVGRPISIRSNQSRVPLTVAPASVRRVQRALAQVDVVHLHEPMMPLVGWTALRTSKPLVATFHADAPRWVAPAYRMTPGLRRRMGDAVLTAVSTTAAASVPGSWGEVDIIPNAVDTTAFQSGSGRVMRRVVFLGRDDPRKGLDLLLKAWSQVRAEHSDSELVVIGAERKGDIDGVEFRGRVSEGEKRRVLGTSAVLAAPNTGGESFGIVLIEAQAAGCAIVASDLPGFREVARDSVVFVPPGDVLALATALSALLGDEAELRRLSESGRQNAARYDWSVVLDRYVDAYQRAISG